MAHGAWFLLVLVLSTSIKPCVPKMLDSHVSKSLESHASNCMRLSAHLVYDGYSGASFSHLLNIYYQANRLVPIILWNGMECLLFYETSLLGAAVVCFCW